MPVSINLDLVTYSILLGDGPGMPTTEEIPASLQVMDFSVYLELDKIPYASLKIVDGNAAESDFEIGNSELFRLGKSISIKLGYHGEETKVFEGIIVNNSHNLTGKNTSFNLICKHQALKMTMRRNRRHFNDLSDSDIIEMIFGEYGFGNLDIEPFGVTHEQLVQSNVSDWDFAISRADMNGVACLLHDAVKFFKPDPSEEEKLTLTFGDNLLSFRTESDLRSQSASVSAFAWDPNNQSVVEQASNTPPNVSPGIFDPDEIAQSLGQSLDINSTSSNSTEILQSIADAKRQRQALSKVQGQARFNGDGSLLPGDWVLLRGLGDQFNGKAFVSAVEHNYSNGNWVTTASIGWKEDFFAERFNPFSPLSNTGQFAGLEGLHNGIVTDIIDPLGQGRIRVRLPIVNPDEAGIWARLATLDAGNQRGTFFMPELDDEVIVGFLGGDPSHPVILGMLHSNANPPPLDAETANNEKGYVSRSEIKIIIHDGDNSVTIETPGGRVIKMDDSGSEIEIKDSEGNTIKMDSSGISMESQKDIMIKAGASLTLGAPQLAISADMSASLEASGSLTLSGSGETELKGGMVKIEGGLVKIN